MHRGQRNEGWLNLSQRLRAMLDQWHDHEWFRIGSFLAIGGGVALFNLAEVALLERSTLPHVVYVTLATEGSIFLSFFLNDTLTFRAPVNKGRSWVLRCIRFHSAAAVGALFTILLSTALYHLFNLSSVVAQAIALFFATIVNFSIHRFWTYRAVKPALEPDPVVIAD